ncbi:MAG: hypothetical protein DLM73_08345 [Chthoniobacterales bacterium]|nr:MAG: hypothetical protein DLM73_08345 [Chthoniobacterales bacterium]
MKRRLAILLGLVVFAAGPVLRAETDDEVEAHRLVLDLTGAFTNDGFKLRDGHWAGQIKPAERALVAVNLYAGNQYWFAAAANTKAKKIAVDLFDETGKPLTTETYNEGERAAAGFSPTTSGQYFVSVSFLEGEPTAFCLVYSYK